MGRRKGWVALTEARKLGNTRSKLVSVFVHFNPVTKQYETDTVSKYGVRELSRKAGLPVSTVSYFIKHHNDFLIRDEETGKHGHGGSTLRAYDMPQTQEEIDEQHVTFFGRTKDSPRQTDFQPMVPGSNAPPPGFHPMVWRPKKKRVKGGHEIEGYEIATHD